MQSCEQFKASRGSNSWINFHHKKCKNLNERIESVEEGGEGKRCKLLSRALSIPKLYFLITQRGSVAAEEIVKITAAVELSMDEVKMHSRWWSKEEESSTDYDNREKRKERCKWPRICHKFDLILDFIFISLIHFF